MSFKVGDKVAFKEGELSCEWYRGQAVGVGRIIETGRRSREFDVAIRWEDGSQNAYASCDLIHHQENPMRTIPTKEQVLQAAKRCPQTKEALEILFPEDFKLTPIRNIINHFAIVKGAILMSPQVQEQLRKGVWNAKYGARGPVEILSHPMFEGWTGTYVSGKEMLELIADILALKEL